MKRYILSILLIYSVQLATAQLWTALDGGIDAAPTATTSTENALVTASVVESNDSFRLHRISVWNGYYWLRLPLIKADPKSIINSMTFYKGALYLAGRIDSVDGIPGVQHILRWVNRKYEVPPNFVTALNDFNSILQLTVHNNLLIATGPFAVNAGVNGKNIAFYNGTALVNSSVSSNFGAGVSGSITAAHSNGTILAIGGRFNTVDDTSSLQLAYLYQGRWIRFPNNNIVPRVITSDGDTNLFIIGNALNSKDLSIYKTTGTNVDSMNHGIETIYALFDIIHVDGVLYASGIFELDNQSITHNLIYWNGSSWRPAKNGNLTGLRDLEMYRDQLIGSGPFVYNDFQKLNFIAAYKSNIGIVTGQVYFDKDEDCKFGDRDVTLNNMYVVVNPGQHIAKPGVEGRYVLFLEEGEYQARIIHPAYWRSSSCSADTVNFKISTGQVLNKVDFPMVQNTGIRDLSIKLSSKSGLSVTKNRHVSYTILYENKGSENVAETEVKLRVDPRLNEIKFSPEPVSFQNDTATWVVKDLFSGETGKIECVFELTNSSDDQLYMNASISLQENEANPEDNESELTQSLSEQEFEFHKTIISSGGGDSIMLNDSSDKIEYLISFANFTSDTVFDVYVVDTIKLNHSLSYIKTTASSHDVTIEAFPGVIGEDIGIIVWTFKDINLYPNPNHEPEIVSHQGFISFELGLTDQLQEGQILTNRASVVFDYYEAEGTNQTYALVSNELVSLQPIHVDFDLNVYPNPSEGYIYVDSDVQNLEGSEFKVIDLSGQVVQSGVLNLEGKIDLNDLSQGVYYLQLLVEDQIIHVKFIKA